MLENISLKEHTTLRIGGPARYFVSVSSVSELGSAFEFARDKHLSVALLGGGSNVLVSDEGFPGVVIKNEIRGVDWNETNDQGTITTVRVGAGESWDDFVKQTVERGLWGLENLSGIPGTVGAAPVQNIGAYGAEIQDALESVETVDARTGEARTLSNAECGFSYRDSVFKRPAGKGLMITRVTFRLAREGKPNLEYTDLKERFKIKDSRFKITPADVRDAVLDIRSKKFPDLARVGTAGSFFKNPIIPTAQFEELRKRYPDLPGFQLPSARYPLPSVKVPLAWILDRVCHLKGFRKNGLLLFERQPIVLVNAGFATAKEVVAFAQETAAAVREKTGIEIEWEVQMLT